MKIGGKKIDSRPASETLYFPREKDEVVAIRANAVMDRSEFDRLLPVPKPPKKRIKGNILVDNPEDPKYAISVNAHGARFIDWLVIQSLCGVNRETQDDEPIEWEIVDKQDAKTWNKWEEELRQSGFSDMERKRIHNMVIKVNSLSDARLDEARASFLQPREPEQDPSSSQNTEQSDTQSGEPVSDSESDHQESQLVGTSSTK